MTASTRTSLPEPPPPFGITRKLREGNYPLGHVFRGFPEVPPFAQYPGDERRTRAIVEETQVQLVEDGTWMYVAPHKVPAFAAEYGWNPFTSPSNCIVVGQKHLAESRSIVLYLDLIHEFFHILQRDTGRELWDVSQGYVGSPTELEAYRFSIAEGRRLGVRDSFLRSYLKVEWVNRKDHQRLLRNLGVKPKG